jgi:hypothetical protein
MIYNQTHAIRTLSSQNDRSLFKLKFRTLVDPLSTTICSSKTIFCSRHRASGNLILFVDSLCLNTETEQLMSSKMSCSQDHASRSLSKNSAISTFKSQVISSPTPTSSKTSESLPSLSAKSQFPPRRFYSYKKFRSCALSFRSSSPSYTSLSLPKALSKSVPPSDPRNLNLHSKASAFTLCQSFHFSSVAITSLYNSEPPAMEVVCAMSEWKETSTVSGLIVRAAECNSFHSMLDKFRILYLLAFASTPFLIKMACVISELQLERNITYWLQMFIYAVEESLINGSREEDYFDAEDQEILQDAYERNMKITSGSGGDGQYEILRVVAHPSQTHTGGVTAPNHRDREQTITYKHYPVWKLESSADGMSLEDSLSDEFWAC